MIPLQIAIRNGFKDTQFLDAHHFQQFHGSSYGHWLVGSMSISGKAFG